MAIKVARIWVVPFRCWFYNFILSARSPPADVSDDLGHICPGQGAIYGDKGYIV